MYAAFLTAAEVTRWDLARPTSALRASSAAAALAGWTTSFRRDVGSTEADSGTPDAFSTGSPSAPLLTLPLTLPICREDGRMSSADTLAL